jgi:hypothetical protein
MITRLLTALVGLAVSRPRLVLLVMTLPVSMALYAFVVPLDLSFGGLMNRDDPEVARYFEASRSYGLGGWLPLLLEGPDEELDAGVDAVRSALENDDAVRAVISDPPRGWIADRAPWLVDRDVFDAWIRLGANPLRRGAARELEAGLRDFETRYRTQDPPGARLVLVILAEDPFELDLDADVFPGVRQRVRDALEPLGLQARFAGMAAIVTQEQESTLERLRILAPVSLLLVLLILRAVERRLLVLAAIAVAMLFAVGTTLGLVGWWVGKLTLMESVFGILVFGLGVDFGLHLMIRLREERERGATLARGIERSVAGTGRGIVAGDVTSGGAFLILTLAPDPVFYQLGLSGGIGLLLCLVFLLTLLPAAWALLERPTGEAVRRGTLPLPSLGPLARVAVRRPGWTVAAAVAFVAMGTVSAFQLHYETNLERVFSREIRAVETARRIHELFGLDPAPWVVPARDADEARRVTSSFESESLFGRAESLAFLFPEDAEGRASELADVQSAVSRNLWMLKTVRVDGDVIAALKALQVAAEQGPPTPADLPPEIAERWTTPDGELLVYAFAHEPRLDSATAALERRAAQAIHPDATSMTVLFEALIGTNRPWMRGVVAAVLAFVVVILWVDLRSPRLALLALAPVTVGVAMTLGLLQVAGFAFNTVTLVGIPLLLGLGVDNGIHVAHRMQEEPDRPLDAIVDSVGAAIAMTTLTTCASVATLLFSRHPGIESVAILLLVGLPLCMLASVTVLPALAMVLRVRRGSRDQSALGLRPARNSRSAS